MNALLSLVPPAPRVPSDFIFLLTYTAGSAQTDAQRARTNETTARELGVDLDCATNADELV